MPSHHEITIRYALPDRATHAATLQHSVGEHLSAFEAAIKPIVGDYEVRDRVVRSKAMAAPHDALVEGAAVVLADKRGKAA